MKTFLSWRREDILQGILSLIFVQYFFDYVYLDIPDFDYPNMKWREN